MTSPRFATPLPEAGFIFCPWCDVEIYREEVHCPYCGHEPFEPRSECQCKYCTRLRKEWHAKKRQQTYIRRFPWSYTWPRSGRRKNRHT